MKLFIEGEVRSQSTLSPEHLDYYTAEDNSVRVIDVFVDELESAGPRFEGKLLEASPMRPSVIRRDGTFFPQSRSVIHCLCGTNVPIMS